MPVHHRCLTILFFLLSFVQNSTAQREFGTCDSTIHPLNQDTNIVVGRNRLYLKTSTRQTLLYYFPPIDTSYYIRDFDIVQDRLWYTIIGRRYIGGPTQVYRSTDQGQNWQLDTSYYPSVAGFGPYNRGWNNLNHWGSDTLVAFVGYYDSGIIYSVDGGSTWQLWLRNLIEHYHGLFRCRGIIYLYGIAGDGFPPSMFAFPEDKLFTQDSATQWTNWAGTNGQHPDCYNGISSRCIYAPSNQYRCLTHSYFQAHVDSVCNVVLTTEEPVEDSPSLFYPNPTTGWIYSTEPLATPIQLYNALGQPCTVTTTQEGIDLSALPVGWYWIRLRKKTYVVRKQ